MQVLFVCAREISTILKSRMNSWSWARVKLSPWKKKVSSSKQAVFKSWAKLCTISSEFVCDCWGYNQPALTLWNARRELFIIWFTAKSKVTPFFPFSPLSLSLQNYKYMFGFSNDNFWSSSKWGAIDSPRPFSFGLIWRREGIYDHMVQVWERNNRPAGLRAWKAFDMYKWYPWFNIYENGIQKNYMYTKGT